MTSGPTFHALLVGADFYFPNTLPNRSSYRSLNGCVADIAGVEAMLRSRVDADHLEIEKLVASHDRGSGPLENPALWPTAANLRAALAHLLDRAQPGDQVYIHYSGHGGRVKTFCPELKNSPMDEALVPIDIGGDPGIVAERYIRDVELVHYLGALARKVDAQDPSRRVAVTFVFDSCHSGGTTRSLAVDESPLDVASRCATGGESPLDTTPLPPDAFDAATLAAWAAAWTRATAADSTRGAVYGPSWLPDTGSYVLLAACRDSESALEARLGDAQFRGVLTTAFLEALDALAAPTWQTLYDRVFARVTFRFTSQMPLLLGAEERDVFGMTLRPQVRGVSVQFADAARRRVKLGVGLATGVDRGAEFAIHAPRAGDAELGEPLARAVVETAEATTAWARVADGVEFSQIVPGAPARLVRVPHRRRVELHRTGDADDEADALAAVAAAVASTAAGFLELAHADDRLIPHYRVLARDGEYKICDPAGAPLPYTPPIATDAPFAAEQLVDRLLRLRTFHTVQAISAPPSPFHSQVHVALHQTPGCPLKPVEGRYRIAADTLVYLHVENHSPRAISVVCLDLQCDWSIALLVPAVGPLEDIGARELRDFPIKLFVPPGFDVTLDVFKVFATTAPIDLAWLVQPAIDCPDNDPSRGTPAYVPPGPLIATDMPDARPSDNATPVPWTVHQFHVVVMRSDLI